MTLLSPSLRPNVSGFFLSWWMLWISFAKESVKINKQTGTQLVSLVHITTVHFQMNRYFSKCAELVPIANTSIMFFLKKKSSRNFSKLATLAFCCPSHSILFWFEIPFPHRTNSSSRSSTWSRLHPHVDMEEPGPEQNHLGGCSLLSQYWHHQWRSGTFSFHD